jgi:hypothetical protein
MDKKKDFGQAYKKDAEPDRRGDLLQQQEESGQPITFDAFLTRMKSIKRIAQHAKEKVFTIENAAVQLDDAAHTCQHFVDFMLTGKEFKGRMDVADFVIGYLEKLKEQDQPKTDLKKTHLSNDVTRYEIILQVDVRNGNVMQHASNLLVDEVTAAVESIGDGQTLSVVKLSAGTHLSKE